MGGSRSGRQGWRGVIEQRTRLDIRKFRREGWLTPGRVASLSWTSGSSLVYTPHRDHVELGYRVTDQQDVQTNVRITVRIVRAPCRYGGERLYWLCPTCYQRREVVVMASHGKHWGCRTCLRLRYISQGLAPHHRMQRRAEALYARAGEERDDGMIYKHKRMRWSTFDRLMEKANATGEQADAAFVDGLAHLFTRLGITPEDS